MTEQEHASVEEAIAVGAVVTLRSGGPAMTVREITGQEAICEWFDGPTPHERTFKIVSLRGVPPGEDPESIVDKVSDAARSVFDELKERAQGFKDGLNK